MGKITNVLFATGLPKRDRKNEWRVNLWAFAWVLTLLASRAIFEFTEAGAAVLWALVLIHASIALKVVLTYRYFLNQLDELERKVQMDALAMAAGGAIMIFSTGGILAAGGVTPQPSAAFIVVCLSLIYIVSTIIGRWRLS